MSDLQTVSVSILDKEYQISCERDEVDDLVQSAKLLDARMREVKSGSSVLGLDRIAVMAALNIAHDLLEEGRKNADAITARTDEIKSLGGKLDLALNKLRDGVQ